MGVMVATIAWVVVLVVMSASSSALRLLACWRFFATCSGLSKSAWIARQSTCTIGRRTRPCAAARGASFRAHSSESRRRSLRPVDPYNCAEGVLNFGAEWSLEKKQWCCSAHGQGCGQDAEVPAAQYDCNSAFANWVKGWSPGKKRWCCSKGIKSCPSDAAAAGAGYGAGTKHGADFQGAPIAHFNVVPYSQTGGR